VAGTPMYVLTNESNCPTVGGGGMPFDFSPAQSLASASSATLNADVAESAHTIALQDIVEVTAETVKMNLVLARNTVTPIVNHVHDCVQRALHDADMGAGVALSIQPDTYAAIWDSPVLLSMVDIHSQAELESQAMPRYYPPMSPESIRKLLGTGSSRFDKDVCEWADTVGDDFLQSVYSNTFLVGADAMSATVQTLNRMMMSDFRNRNRSLAILLMARGLKDVTPEDVNLTPSQHDEAMAGVIQQASVGVLNILERREMARDQKQLILEYPMRGLEANMANAARAIIYVNGDIYKQWLQDGGTVETLLGAYITDQERGYQQLIDSKDIMTDAWARRVALIRSQAMSNRYGIMLNALKTACAEEINSLNDEVMVGTQRGPYYDLLEKAIDGVVTHDMDNLYQMCRRVVCNVMFPHTSAMLVLNSLDAVMQANPDLDVREAALVATLDILVSWWRAQVDVYNAG
jgi:hypothetical protein